MGAEVTEVTEAAPVPAAAPASAEPRAAGWAKVASLATDEDVDAAISEAIDETWGRSY